MPATIGSGLREAHREQHRQQLGLVAHLAERDDTGGDEKGFARSVPRAASSGPQRRGARRPAGSPRCRPRRGPGAAPTAGEVALHRLQVDRVVVRDEQVAHDLGRATGARGLLPGVRRPRCRAARAARRAARRTPRCRRRRSRSPRAAGARVRRAPARARRSGEARMCSISAGGTRRSPTFLLSLSTYTGRAGSKRRSASQTRESNCFWPGCALPGTRPSTEPRWFASASRSSTCAPCALPAPAAGGSCRSRWCRRPRGTRSAAGSVSSAAIDRAPVFAVAALEHGARESRSGRARARARRCACRRASSRPAACQSLRLVDHLALDVGGDVARHHRRTALLRGEGRDLLVLGADDAALVVVQRRPVDGAGQAVFGELALGARVDDGVEARPGAPSASAAVIVSIRRQSGLRGSIASSSSVSICSCMLVLLQRRRRRSGRCPRRVRPGS